MDKEVPGKAPWWQESVTTFSEVTGLIAFPVVGGIFLGQYLDDKWGTEPWAMIVLTFLGMLIAGVSLWRLIKRYQGGGNK